MAQPSVSGQLAWIGYLALGVGCIFTAVAALASFAGLNSFAVSGWSAAANFGQLGLSIVAIVGAAVLAFRRRIYLAWGVLAVAYVPLAISVAASILHSTS